MDYPELIAKKADIIRSTTQLNGLLGQLDGNSNEEEGYLKGLHYLALGCDLNDMKKFERLLSHHIDISQCMILCTAEVSLTYMNVDAADALIEWAAQYEDGRRNKDALLQFLPFHH